MTYKIVQNYLSNNDFEYSHEYKTTAEAQKDINEYIKEDIELKTLHSYDIIDNDTGDKAQTEAEFMHDSYISAIMDMGSDQEEAERVLEDMQMLRVI